MRPHQTVAALATLALTPLVGCTRHAGPEQTGRAAGPQPATIAVRTAAAERGAAQAALAPAVVEARQRAALRARVSATVVALPFREGQAVPAGAVAVRLEARAPQAAVAAAAADADAARTDQKRYLALLGRGAATQREADEAGARAAAADARLAAARDALDYAVLRAPFAARLARRNVSVGDVVAPGQPLVELEGVGALELRASVDRESAAGLRPGQALLARVDGQAGAVTATVTSVSAAADPGTHRFEVRADLPDAPGLRSGLFARLETPRAADGQAVFVPAAALFERGGLTGVYVVAGERASLRWVARGSAQGERVEVRAGLRAGERVVLEPEGLTDGAPVRER